MLKASRIGGGDPSLGSTLNQIKAFAEKGHRQVSDVVFYQLELTVDGKVFTPTGAVGITFEYEQPMGIGLLPYMEAEADVYGLYDAPARMVGADLNDSLEVKGFRVSGKALTRIALAGIQNRVNDGKEAEEKALKKDLKDVLSCGVFANELEADVKKDDLPLNILAGSVISNASEEDEQETETEAEEEKAASQKKAESVKKSLKDLEKVSLALANAKSSEQITVINIYADEKGNIDDEPLKAVLTDDGRYIDVTDAMVIVNIIADREDQKLTVPSYDIENTVLRQDADEVLAKCAKAGCVLYNFAVLKNGSYSDFKGQVIL